ncbi:MAG: glycosyltransferase family 2 protein [Eubacteriales bacterium]|nr:glycosyltransferase family 2 protein [Eubacteriales bacterium]
MVKKILHMLRRLTPYNIKKGLLYLKHYGPREFWVRLTERMEEQSVDYQKWYEDGLLTEEERAAQKRRKWKNPVKISVVVPAYRTPEEYLRQMIESVQRQTYENWELCIADGSGRESAVEAVVREYQEKDARIRYRLLEKNDGIAGNTNAAIAMAEGEYVALFDHDDLLAEDALYEAARVIEREWPDLIYTDEDKVRADLSEHFQPHFKPDFNPDLLCANNYICHLVIVRKRLADEVGGFRAEFDGAQDHDFLLRITEKTEKIAHIPKILYHWRIHKASTADNPASKMYAYDAGKRAVLGHLNRMGLEAEVEHTKDYGFYRVHYPVQGTPLVSIVIPNKDEKETLEACLTSIREKTTYPNYEIVIVENNSVSEEIFRYYQEIDGKNRIRVVYWKEAFNYSKINNFGISQAKGDYLICLNNDITVITPGWIEEMLGYCQRPGTGIVGARLYFPDDTIQHAGIAVGIGGCAGSLFVGMSRKRTGYMHKVALVQDLSAVTAACMMVKREAFEAAGGFEEKLAVAFNDVDFCLKVRRAGYLVVYNPYVEMYHFESKTRGPEDSPEKQRRFQSEIEYMRSNWLDILKKGDPYYNRNLSLKACDYSIKPRKETKKRKAAGKG